MIVYKKGEEREKLPHLMQIRTNWYKLINISNSKTIINLKQKQNTKMTINMKLREYNKHQNIISSILLLLFYFLQRSR